MYRIHGGTIVCWRAAAVGAAGCEGGACVGVVCVAGGSVLCVVLGGFSWWSVVAVPRGWSWAWRFLGGCGTCGVGLAGGGGVACVGLRVCLLLSPRSLPLPFPCSSLFAGLFCFFFFFGGAGWGAVCGCGCVPVPAPVWAWVSWGTGVGWLVRSGFPVCASAPRASSSQGAASGGADGRWYAAVVAWRLRWWSRLLGSAWVAWPGVCVGVGVFMAWADGVVGSVGVVGLCGCRVRVRRRRSGLGWGTVGDAMGGGDAGDAYGGGAVGVETGLCC